jgi:hypothetical protein
MTPIRTGPAGSDWMIMAVVIRPVQSDSVSAASPLILIVPPLETAASPLPNVLYGLLWVPCSSPVQEKSR